MKKSLLALWLLLILVASMLSGCLVPYWPGEEGGRSGHQGGHDRGKGDRGHDRGRHDERR